MNARRPTSLHPAVAAVARLDRTLGRVPASLAQLLLRITVALPFWQSGLTKWDGFLTLSPAAKYLFASEFKLHLFGAQIGYPFPTTMAFLAGVAELVLPALLVLGLGTRFAALGLLVMTGVIQLTIPDGWMTYHLPWAAMLLPLLACGGGRVAVDHWLALRFTQP
jgi:putative oxidoreductase